MLMLCENGSNIDYMYLCGTSLVLRKATETKISDLTFWLRFLKTETEPKFGFRTSLDRMGIAFFFHGCVRPSPVGIMFAILHCIKLSVY